MGKRRILLIDMYGVIIKESKGYFIPYTFAHFDISEHERLGKLFWEEKLFTKTGNGALSSEEFLSLLGYENPEETMKDYLRNYVTLDKDFIEFAEKNANHFELVLFSNDIIEWNKYLLDLHGLSGYFQDCIVSGEAHMRKPEPRIYVYVLERLQCKPEDCIFIDNSVNNLSAAQVFGINTILFNRDNELFYGNKVDNFQELNDFLNRI